MYLKAEFDLSTLALVAGMTNNISKTFIRDFGFSFSFAPYRFHSFNSCSKDDELGRSSLQYSNTSTSSSAVSCSNCSENRDNFTLKSIAELFFTKSIKGKKTARLNLIP